MSRNLVEIRFGNLDVITENRIEADFERGNSGALNFILLQFSNPIFAPASGSAELIEASVKSIPNQAAFFETEWRLIHNRAPHQLHHLRHFIDSLFDEMKQRLSRFRAVCRLIEGRQHATVRILSEEPAQARENLP